MGEVIGWITRENDVLDGSNVTSLPTADHPFRTVQELGGLAAGRVRDIWPEARLSAVEALWGEGFTAPGGAPETLRLAKPLGLSEQATLLLLGGGLGGAARAINAAYGCWVASLEANDRLRSHAIGRNLATDRITIGAWDRQSTGFARGSAHRVLSLEALRGSAPEPLLENLAACLHPGGQVVLTELVADELPDRRDREFAAWCRLDDRLPELPRPAEVSGGLERRGLRVLLQEDVSDRHIGQTLDGWRQAVRGMANGPRPTNHTASAFVTEAELWLLRIRLMRRLGVRLLRWHAIAG